MSDTETTTSPLPAGAVWAERTGTRAYTGHNERGAQVRIGMGPGEFTPGELLKLALATCNTLSADHRIAAALGEDFDANVIATAVKDEERDSYASLDVRMVADLSGLDEAALTTLRERAAKAIDRTCTVGHTLEDGAAITFTLEADPEA